MKYPTNFVDDLKYLAAYYKWSDEDKKEIRASFTGSPEMVNFYTVLAAAHRAGYSQHAGNGFIRLQAWCIENGYGDPFGPAFDVKALDAASYTPRQVAA